MPTSNDCPRCNGTGVYNGTRRDGSTYEGPCFACQGGGPRGVGRRFYGVRAAPAAHAVRRDLPAAPFQSAPMARPTVAAANAPVWTARQQANLDAFAVAEPLAWVWLVNNAETSDFAASLRNGIARYGNLTPRQLACVMRNVDAVAPAAAPAWDSPEAIAARAAEVAARPASVPVRPVMVPAAPLADIRTAEADEARRAAERARATVAAPVAVTVDLDRVRNAMESARASGLRKVRLTFGEVTMKLSGSTFRAGAGLILCYHNGAYRGYVDTGNVWHSRMGATVDAATLDAFRAVGIDPRAAAATHGHETGNCACCRRLLTDPPSVMAGIGPICIRRFGWGF